MSETKLVLRIDVLTPGPANSYVPSVADDKALFTKIHRNEELRALGSIYFADAITTPNIQLSPNSQFLALLPVGSSLPIQPWFDDNISLGTMLSCAVTQLSYWATGIVTRPDSPRRLEQAGVEQHLINKFVEAIK